MFEKLKSSRQFWLAVLAAAWNILFYFVPNFPEEVRNSVNILLVTLITAITVENTARAFANAKAPYTVEAVIPFAPEQLSWLLKSRKFWIAVVAAAQSILFSLVPDFPPEIWQSINAIAIVVMAVLTVDDSAGHIASAVRYNK